MISISILFSGRGTNAESILKSIITKDLNFKVKKVICNNSHADGIIKIENLGINVSIVEQKKYSNIKDFNKAIKNELNPKKGDLLLLCGYMKKIPNNIIKSYLGNVINIHPSLLPKYKGLNTHERAIKNKDKYSGCTVHFVNSKLDSGKIINQKKVKICKFDNSKTLAKKILIEEHKLYPAAIMKILSL